MPEIFTRHLYNTPQYPSRKHSTSVRSYIDLRLSHSLPLFSMSLSFLPLLLLLHRLNTIIPPYTYFSYISSFFTRLTLAFLYISLTSALPFFYNQQFNCSYSHPQVSSAFPPSLRPPGPAAIAAPPAIVTSPGLRVTGRQEGIRDVMLPIRATTHGRKIHQSISLTWSATGWMRRSILFTYFISLFIPILFADTLSSPTRVVNFISKPSCCVGEAHFPLGGNMCLCVKDIQLSQHVPDD